MTDQEQHAQIFGHVSRAIMLTAATFAKDVGPTLTPMDVSKIYMATGAWLAATIADRTGAVAMLRELADSLERQDDQVKPN
jgi:hypothetical protein